MVHIVAYSKGVYTIMYSTTDHMLMYRQCKTVAPGKVTEHLKVLYKYKTNVNILQEKLLLEEQLNTMEASGADGDVS
jgi:hypothetical protein